MARTTMEMTYASDFEHAEQVVNRVFLNNGFNKVTLKTGENVWKKGTGFLTAMQFVKVEYATDKIILSAWVQAGVGSVGGGEMDLSGFVAAFPKKQLMNVLQKLKSEL